MYVLRAHFTHVWRPTLSAQSVLIDKISESELRRKFIKRELLVGDERSQESPNLLKLAVTQKLEEGGWGERAGGEIQHPPFLPSLSLSHTHRVRTRPDTHTITSDTSQM